MRIILRFIQLCIFLLLIWLGGLGWFFMQIPTRPVNDSVKTDAIVVFTGGGLRLEHGFELMERDAAPRMLVSGVESLVTMQELMRSQEVGPISPEKLAQVELGRSAQTTEGNARETAEWVKAHNVRSIRLVTASYHIPRSQYELHRELPELVIIPDPVFPGRFAHAAWWSEPGTLSFAVSEYHKYLASLARDMLQGT